MAPIKAGRNVNGITTAISVGLVDRRRAQLPCRFDFFRFFFGSFEDYEGAITALW
jgi:hypothetical protein